VTDFPYARKWDRYLSENYGRQKSGELISKARAYFDKFLLQYAGQISRAQQEMLTRRILPGLSIYKSLLDENPDHEKVLEEVQSLFRIAFFTVRMQGIRILNLLPDPFPVVRPVLRSLTRNEYLPGSQQIIEDSNDCFAFNVYRCFILDVLEENNAAELTVLFCKTDDWLAECLPKVEWKRTKTLGRGDDCCDFRWCRR
jgi:hypothetical protein